jgi:hypothetical protein
MNFDTIGIGTTPNDGTGDPLRTAFGKVNTNFAKAIAFTSNNSDPVDPPTDQTVPSRHLNAATGFSWEWDVNTLAWVPIPKMYVALMTQSGTAAPTVTILKNTLGGVPTWGRDEAGHYEVVLAGAFPDGKTGLVTGTPEACNTSVHWQDASTLHVVTYNIATNQRQDNYLLRTLIEIYVYP